MFVINLVFNISQEKIKNTFYKKNCFYDPKKLVNFWIEILSTNSHQILLMPFLLPKRKTSIHLLLSFIFRKQETFLKLAGDNIFQFFSIFGPYLIKYEYKKLIIK